MVRRGKLDHFLKPERYITPKLVCVFEGSMNLRNRSIDPNFFSRFRLIDFFDDHGL